MKVMNMQSNELGQLLRGAREELGISQTELARRVGVGPTVISKLETGTRKGSRSDTRDTLIALAQELGLDPQRVLEVAGQEPRTDISYDRPEFEEFVLTEPTLTGAQKRAVIALYRSFVNEPFE